LAIAFRGVDNNVDYTALRLLAMRELSTVAYATPNDQVITSWNLVYGYDHRQQPLRFANIFEYIQTMYQNARGAGDTIRWGSMQDSLPLSQALNRTIVVVYQNRYHNNRWEYTAHFPNYATGQVICYFLYFLFVLLGFC
jgi:hypothetical protein